ncbi:MAG TPA: excinuclease ATPase subunit [Burkholderiaceae bacterium]|jgi:uncharacterized protein YbjQ (UPF0145 family)|nr:excinuclease ATPase subunit [Burkholderiaceae bacterium]
MKKIVSTMVILGAVMAMPAHASDNKVMLPIAGAMADNNAQGRLGDSVKFYFGNQPTPKILQKLGGDTTSQKTNAFAKTNEKACNWVFLSDMLALEKRAKELGANAVYNIVSNYENIENSSDTEFECHVGGIMAGVAFKAQFAKVSGN